MITKASPPVPSDLDATFADLRQQVGEKFTYLNEGLQSGDLTPSEWRDQAGSVLRSAYRDAYAAGNSFHGADTPIGAQDRAIIDRYLSEDLDYLHGFYQDIKDAGGAGERGLSDAYMDNRTDLYGDSIQGLWWAGATDAQDPGVQIDWIAEPDACDACQEAASGGPYTSDDLPGMPGADVCEGLDRCRCSLEYTDIATGTADGSEEDMGDMAA